MTKILINNKAKTALLVASTATTAFVAGKYYERNRPWTGYDQWSNLKDYPALPVFASASVEDVDTDISTGSSVLSLNRLQDLAQKLRLGINRGLIFTSVQAATPFTEHATEVVPHASEPSKPNRVGQIMKHGFPGLDNVRSFDDYVLSYDRRNRVAHWVFEHLTADTVKKNDQVDRSKCDFMPDDSIHPFFRANNSDYKKSGYDRGHLAAAGNHKAHQKHVEQTFYLSNIAPQVGKGFNRDSWNRLEKHVRKLTKIYPNVYCCTGPLYLPKREPDGKLYIKYEVIGANHVAVPTHFYKIVVGETKDGKLEMESYVMANQVIDDNIPLENFKVSPEVVEKAAGLLFFSNVNKKNISKINGRKN